MRVAAVVLDGAPVVVGGDDEGRWRELTTVSGCADIADLLDSCWPVRLADLMAGTPVVAAGAIDRYRSVVGPRSRVFCAGFNYPAPERERPTHPTIFLRTPSSLVGHAEPVVLPSVSSRLDWEGEIAVVIGRPGRHISPMHAWTHVFGLTCFADNTVRDFARHGTQATAGKNFDRSGAVGPAVVALDSVPPLADILLTTRVNGRTVQHAAMSQLLTPVPELISYLSDVVTLRPGDVIATGTPSGIGARLDPPRFLAAGDVVEVEATGIGRLRNEIVAEPPT